MVVRVHRDDAPPKLGGGGAQAGVAGGFGQDHIARLGQRQDQGRDRCLRTRADQHLRGLQRAKHRRQPLRTRLAVGVAAPA